MQDGPMQKGLDSRGTADPGEVHVSVHVLLPCLNEESSVERMAASLSEVFSIEPEFRVTAIFIDDGSHDGTWQAIQRLHQQSLHVAVGGIRLEDNHGKAAAQAIGLREIASSTGMVVLMDSDGQHDPSRLPLALRACLKSHAPQVARRTEYKRDTTSVIGTVGLSLIAGLTGVRFDPALAEYVVLPERTVRLLARNPQLGVVPIVPLIQGSVPRVETFPSPVLDRSDGSQSTRWTKGQLWHKGLLVLLANPWAMLPRLALAIAITGLLLGSYGLVVGVASVMQGTFLGVGSVLVGMVLVFSVLAVLQLVTLGLVVVLFRSGLSFGSMITTDLEILDWPE